MMITGERHLRLVLGKYTDHYNGHRPHRTLQQHPPAEMIGMRVVRRDRLGGLIHEYSQVAWGDTISGTRRPAPRPQHPGGRPSRLAPDRAPEDGVCYQAVP
jgi:hypothetical protein